LLLVAFNLLAHSGLSALRNKPFGFNRILLFLKVSKMDTHLKIKTLGQISIWEL